MTTLSMPAKPRNVTSPRWVRGCGRALREALGKRPSAEARKRLQRLLDDTRPRSEDELRGQRAVRVLEWAGDTQARDLLKTVAAGDPAAPLTREAKAALGRLGRTAEQRSPRPSKE